MRIPVAMETVVPVSVCVSPTQSNGRASEYWWLTGSLTELSETLPYHCDLMPSAWHFTFFPHAEAGTDFSWMTPPRHTVRVRVCKTDRQRWLQYWCHLSYYQENIYVCHEIPALSSIIIAEDLCCVLLHPTTQTTLFVHPCIYAVH